MHACPTLRSRRPRALFLLGSLLALLTPLAHSATLTFGTSAPTGGAASISNWTGATFDADNVGGSGVNANGSPNNGAANDGTTYVATDRPAQGQTFTTGSNTGGYTLNAITVRVQGYTNNTASGGNIGGYDLNDTTSTFRIRVGRLSGTTFIPLTQETAAAGGTGNPGQGGTANGPGTYLTFTLKAPIVLAANTTYAFDLGTTGDYFEMLGIRDAATGGNPYAGGTAYTSGASGAANGTVTTQAGERVFQVDLTAYTPPAAGTFVHPGLLNTEADFERMRTQVALGVDPWLSAYNALDTSWMSANGSWGSHAQATITRGATNDTSRLYNDIAVIYGSALRWKVSGDTAYADQAVTLLNSWSSTLTTIAGDTNALLTELYAYQFAAAAEIMRTYPAWQPADIAQCQTMLYNVFYPLAHNFLTGHNGTSNDHYWANWDLCAINSLYALGVFCDNPALTTEALDYFYNGIGNGCIDRTVNFIHPGYLGQGQEIGRDQGHATLNVAELATLCQMAWNQGVDLFGYENNRVLSLAEYTAKYNLMQDVPFTPYAEESWLMTGPSSASRGLTGRPGWATLYHHYVNLKGLATPYTKTIVDQNGVNWSWNGDSPGWDALTAALPPIATGANPSGLTATVTAQQPVLSWWGSAYATSYNVKRATTSGGAYTTVATGVTTNTYTDTSVASGTTYYYVVTATTPTGETGNSNEASASVGTSLLARLKLDETSGTSAADSTGNGWTGTLVNSPTWTAGTISNAVNLTAASSQYVTLPSGVASSLSDFSISAWVYQNSANTSARIFDFGTGNGMYGGVDPWGNQRWLSERYLYLAPQGGGGKLKFGITRSTQVGEESVEGSSALPVGQWTHVIVSKSGSTTTLYVNGQVVGQNASMPMYPSQLPPTPNNYLGKSQWPDPYFDGKIDDFRIYRGALAAADAQTLANLGVVHLKFDEASGTTAADSTANGWNGTLVNGATWTTGQIGNAVNLASASSQYVTLPAGVVNGLTTCTLTSWVYLNSTSNWARVFDFGTGTTNYMFLSPKNGANGKIRFAIRTPSVAEQIIDGTTMATAGWHHVAVTLNGATGTLYVDGAQVGQNTAMTLNPSSLGSTTLNYLGKSQFSDPYLNGKLDDFHIYGTVLTAAQISTLYAGLATPGTPTVTTGDSQNTVSWTGVTNATSYTVMRSTTSGGPYVVLAAGLTGTSYTDTGLTNGTSYYYVIVAQNSLAQSSSSTQASGAPVTPAPTGLVASGWNTQAYLSWTAVSGASSYNIKRSTTSGGTYTTIATGVTTTTYSDTGLTNGTPYYYVVSAIKAVEGGNSAQAAATPSSDPAAAPWTQQDIGSVAASGNASYSAGVYTVTGSGADIWGTADAFHYVWQTLTGDGVVIARVATQANTDLWAKAGVMIRDTLAANSAYAGIFITPGHGAAFQYRTTAGGATTNAVTAGRVAPCWVKLLRIGSMLTAYVSADGVTWTSAGSTTIALSSTTYVGLADTSHLDGTLCAATFDNVSVTWAVTSTATVTATPGPLQIALSWTSVPNATTYNVYSSATSGGPYTAVATGLTSPSYVQTGFTSGATVYYVVTGVNVVGEGPASTEISAAPIYPPVAPTGLTATGGNTQAVLGWTASSGATSYNVKRATTSGGAYTTIATGVTTTSYTDTGLTNGTTYYYVVSGLNSAGEGANSAEASALLIPPAPAGLSATSSGTQVSLTWTAASGAASYTVKRATTSGGSYTDIATGLTSPTYTDTGLTPGTTYYYVVSAANGSGASANSSEVVGVPVPAAPGGASATVSGIQIALSWSATNGATAYNVKRSTTSGGAYTTVASGVTAMTYTNTGLATGATYYYVVTATNGTGESAASTEVSGTLTPSAPAGLSATSSGTQVSLSWTAASGATSYTVKRSTTSGGAYTTIASGLTSPAYVNTGLTPGTTYYYVVSATNGGGESANSAQVSGLPVPAAPANPASSGTGTQINLSWSAAAGATTYNVKRSITSGSSYTTIASGLTTTTYADTGLVAGATYYYVITATNVTGEGAASSETSTTLIALAPTGLSAIGWNGAVDLSWNTTGGATGYNVKRATTSGGAYTTVASSLTATTYSDTAVTNGTTYYYVVSAINAGGESANSSEVSTTFTQPVAYLKFDETSGTSAADSSGNGWTGTLVNGPLWSAGRSNNTVDLDGSNDYVTLPTGVVNGLTNFTITLWANLDALSSWSRLFDFGTGTTVNMFLTPKNGANSKIRFAITTGGGNAEQRIDGTAALPIGGWHHVAVTLSGSTGTLYVDGVQVGQNTAMTLTPSSLGSTTQNRIGRSQYNDPYLMGRIDEFRVYSRALSSAEIVSLMNTSPAGLVSAPASLTATAGTAQVALNWSTVTGATSYDVMRTTTNGGLFAPMATGLTTTSYTDTGLTTGTIYYYVIIARTSTSESVNSPQASATAQ